ncbi:hypothetical protein ABIA33_005953 [Streptacidiphilus sp. MAP12-16]|uniref:hypothetical protein n=1 Tax=Streptacidiphilus sp. MAP12-16 TaxID=3156300 RepID=UPI0035167D34
MSNERQPLRASGWMDSRRQLDLLTTVKTLDGLPDSLDHRERSHFCLRRVLPAAHERASKIDTSAGT